eukprot:jgi/Bigna1/70096/fgenesh1_pg.10_\
MGVLARFVVLEILSDSSVPMTGIRRRRGIGEQPAEQGCGPLSGAAPVLEDNLECALPLHLICIPSPAMVLCMLDGFTVTWPSPPSSSWDRGTGARDSLPHIDATLVFPDRTITKAVLIVIPQLRLELISADTYRVFVIVGDMLGDVDGETVGMFVVGDLVTGCVVGVMVGDVDGETVGFLVMVGDLVTGCVVGVMVAGETVGVCVVGDVVTGCVVGVMVAGETVGVCVVGDVVTGCVVGVMVDGETVGFLVMVGDLMAFLQGSGRWDFATVRMAQGIVRAPVDLEGARC